MPANAQALRLEGEVVEIFERQGRRLARVRLEPHAVIDVGVADLGELHLGERLLVDCSLCVESTRRELRSDAGPEERKP